MVVASVMPVVHHNARPIIKRADTSVKFGNAAIAKAVVGALESPPAQSFWLRAWQFFTSIETFYRFWTEILAATLSGCFLLASAKLRLKNNPAAAQQTGLNSLQTQAYLLPIARRMMRPVGAQRLAYSSIPGVNPFKVAPPISRITPRIR